MIEYARSLNVNSIFFYINLQALNRTCEMYNYTLLLLLLLLYSPQMTSLDYII